MARNVPFVMTTFTTKDYLQSAWLRRQPDKKSLSTLETVGIGVAAAFVAGVLTNPMDVVKTRLQKQIVHPGKAPKYTGLLQACVLIAKEEGVLALWKGITPRLLRIMPGQAITFMVYEAVTAQIHRFGLFQS